MSEFSESLLRGAKEALDHAKGVKKSGKEHKVYIPDNIDVKAVRETLRLSRPEFSRRFGFNVRTLEKWEQGTRHPDAAARAYLTVIAKAPKRVITALQNTA